MLSNQICFVTQLVRIILTRHLFIVANRLAKEFGLQIIDIKSAVDYVLKELHYTKTARKIHEHLQKERLLTDEMAVLAIEAVIISPR